MAQLVDIQNLAAKIGDLQGELRNELAAGGDLQTCRAISADIESIAATLATFFQSTAEIVVDQVRAQSPTAPTDLTHLRGA